MNTKHNFSSSNMAKNKTQTENILHPLAVTGSPWLSLRSLTDG